MFGELLEKVPKSLLSSKVRYQNPGYYFEAAASAAKFRKQYVKKLCEPYRELAEKTFGPDTDFEKDEDHNLKTGYFGQREGIFFSSSLNYQKK